MKPFNFFLLMVFWLAFLMQWGPNLACKIEKGTFFTQGTIHGVIIYTLFAKVSQNFVKPQDTVSRGLLRCIAFIDENLSLYFQKCINKIVQMIIKKNTNSKPICNFKFCHIFTVRGITHQKEPTRRGKPKWQKSPSDSPVCMKQSMPKEFKKLQNR